MTNSDETKPNSPREATPVNWRVVLMSFTVLVASATTVTMLFPFLPWMVRKFKINGEFVTEDDTGYYAGLVASSYFLGRFLGCYYWGILSDRYGRRKTILTSGTAIFIFTILFGFTNTTTGLAWAMITRLLSGASNGIIVACKTVIADVSDDTNQAKGMAFVTSAWGLGIIMGPALGGLLAEPVRQYPNVFPKGFLETFPYILPCISTSLILLIGLVIIYFGLPETLPSIKKKHAYNVVEEEQTELETMAVHFHADGANGSVTIQPKLRQDEEDDKEEEEEEEEEEGQSDLRQRRYSVAFVSEMAGLWMRVRSIGRRVKKAGKKATFVYLMKMKGSRMAVLTYCVFSFSVIGSDELTSLWMAAKPYKGGLGFSEKEIGISLAVASALLVPFQLAFTHRLERRLGSMMTYYISCSIAVFGIAIVPALASVTNSVLLWSLLFILFVVMRFSIGVSFVMISMFINNSVPNHLMGAVNGLAVSLTAAARAIAPLVGGSLFAWCISWGADHIGFPFDYHLSFYLFSLVFISSLFLSVNLPQSLQEKHKSD